MSPLLPLGVDILELKKASAFYSRHRARLSTLFHPGELAFVTASAKPSEAFAFVFAAKEAVFKALDAPYLGIEGFRDIHLFPKKNFSFRLSGRLKKKLSFSSALKISFRKTKRHLIATCHPAFVKPCVGI